MSKKYRWTDHVEGNDPETLGLAFRHQAADQGSAFGGLHTLSASISRLLLFFLFATLIALPQFKIYP